MIFLSDLVCPDNFFYSVLYIFFFPLKQFAFLANLFIAHPTLRTDPIPFVTDYEELQKLIRNKNESLRLAKMGQRGND